MIDLRENQQEIVNQLKQIVNSFTEKDRLSGSLLFAHKDNILYSQGFGFANKEKSILNSIDTKFNLASMNKMFTSLAIAILEEQEKLSINHFVNDFIANLPFGKITIHQLLTHTSGIGDFFNDRFLEKRTYLNNLSDYLPLFINDKLQFEPGTRFQYSNGGYIILGLIIEKVSNLSYFDFVKKYIFNH